MERDVPFDFLHGLMDVAIEHGDGAKSLEIGERLGAVVRAPAPVGIHGPERDVSEYHDRRARGEPFHIILQPLQLFGPERAESTCLEVQDVHQADEMHPFLIEAVPASTFGSLAVPLQILLAVIAQDVVLARDVEHLACLGALQHLVHGVELTRS